MGLRDEKSTNDIGGGNAIDRSTKKAALLGSNPTLGLSGGNS